jgi:uncharacterized OsmC-like protein
MSIVTRAAATPSLETHPPAQKPRIKPGEPICFSYDVTATAGAGQLKHGVILSPRPDYSSWDIQCDEGTGMGGDDSAPSPLGYLIMGVAFCLLTHIKGYLDLTPLKVDQVRVEIRADYAMLKPDPALGGQGVGRCDNYSCHVLIDSDEAPEAIAELVAICRDACMAMTTVATAVPTATRVFINGAADGITV